jgi:L-ascorbate metabolism protein UlaG (beta-lactamase superfamily)
MSVAQNIKVDYLFNSGWIIETTGSFVLIDFVPGSDVNLISVVHYKLQSALANNKNVYIFVTHFHQDHYSPTINNWNQPKINYIYGWLNSEAREGAISLEQRDSIKIHNIEIFTHPSTDAGSAFLIKLPEATFYHAGDHALWSENQRKNYEEELMYISSKSKIDLAFLPVVRGKLTGCKTDHLMFSGSLSAHTLLKPEYTFPMHTSCGDFNAFADWEKYMKKSKVVGTLMTPKNYNETFEITLK